MQVVIVKMAKKMMMNCHKYVIGESEGDFWPLYLVRFDFCFSLSVLYMLEQNL